MRIYRSYKTELDPTNKQRTAFAMHAGVARFVYNWSLARRIEQYKSTGKSQTAYEESVDLNAVKRGQFPWMLECSKWVPQAALLDLDRTFQAFYRRCNRGDKSGFPKFRNKRRGFCGFRVYLRAMSHVKSGKLRLPRIGWVRTKEKGYLPQSGKILGVTVSKRAGRWFVAVEVEEEIAVPENQGSAVGIDLGLRHLATASDGRKWDAPKPLARSLEKLRRLSRWHSRKQKGSTNRRKSAATLARLHYRISCQRADYLHKLTTEIAREHSVICVESLNVSGMIQNHTLARSIGDAGWSELLRQLAYKAEWSGGRVVEADAFYPSSKLCSGCGNKKESLSLAERAYHCEACGLEIDRDVNAAKNILKLHTAGSAGINACEDATVVAPLKQEPSTALRG